MYKYFLLCTVLFYATSFSQQQNQHNNLLLGDALIRAGEFEKAKEIFVRLIQSDPKNYRYFNSLNNIYLQLKDYDASLNLIKERIKYFNRDISLYGMLGNTYYLTGDEKKAFSVWEEALNSFPPNAFNYRIIANYAIERRAFEKAIEYLEKGKTIAEEKKIFSYDLTNLYTVTMQFKKAAEEYCLLLEQYPSEYQLIKSRILAYVNNPGALKTTIEVVKNYRNSQNINFLYLLAELYIEDKNFNEAFSVYIKIDEKKQSKGTDIYNFAVRMLNSNVNDKSAEAFKFIIDNYPNSPVLANAKLGYAKSIEFDLQNAMNKEELTWKPLQKYPVFDSTETNRVLTAYLELIKSYPNSAVSVEALFRVGKVYADFLNNYPKAEYYFLQIIKNYKLFPIVIDAYEEEANVKIKTGNLISAKQILSEALLSANRYPSKINNINMDLARINFYLGNFNDAKTYLNEILKNMKDNNSNDAIELSTLMNSSLNDSSNLQIYAEAEYFLRQNKLREALSRFKNITENPDALFLKQAAKLRMAEIEISMDNYDNSIILLKEISSDEEQNIYADKALYLLGKIFEFGKKDYSMAIQTYETLLTKFPDSVYIDEVRKTILKLKKIGNSI